LTHSVLQLLSALGLPLSNSNSRMNWAKY